MKVIVGLGNPGEKYVGTRHNVGFMVIDELAKKLDVSMKDEKKFKAMVGKGDNTLLVKPETFMNKSGEAVVALLNFYKVKTDELYVIHDDLDIRLGNYKIQKGKGPKVHNGVNSVEQLLGMEDFWRVRVGVDNREGREVPGDEYVLSKFRPEEVEIVSEVVGEVVIELGADKLD